MRKIRGAPHRSKLSTKVDGFQRIGIIDSYRQASKHIALEATFAMLQNITSSAIVMLPNVVDMKNVAGMTKSFICHAPLWASLSRHVALV